MSHFISSSERLIYKNGISITYTTVTPGVYDTATQSVTNAESDTAITAYPKNVKVNQHNYPNLIGKKVTEFLVVATDLPSTPTPQDKITRGSDVYTVDSFVEVVAHEVSTIYKILAVK